MNTALIVRMANTFAQKAPYSLRTRSHYIFWYYLSHIDAFADDMPPDITIPISELKSFLQKNQTPVSKNRHWGSFLTEVEESIKELKSLTTLIPSAEGVIDEGRIVKDPVSVFQDIRSTYDKSGKACYQFTVHPSMKGSLYALARKYVQFTLSSKTQQLNITNIYACRLYPALKSRADSQKHYKLYPELKTSISALRELLEIEPGGYSKSYDLKRYVIDKALKDINENSDIRVWEEYLTRGRTLQGVRFHISSSKYNKNQLSLTLKGAKDEKFKVLESISKQHYHKINLKQFIAFFPKQYGHIVQGVNDEFREMSNSLNGLSQELIESWKQGHIKSNIIQFAKNEILMY